MEPRSTTEDSSQPPAPLSVFYETLLKGVQWAQAKYNSAKEVFKKLLGALKGFPKYLLGQRKDTSKSEEAVADPKTPEEFEKNLDLIAKNSGLDQWYKPGHQLLKAVAKEAAKLRNDPNNLLKSPQQLQNLSRVAMYQLVLYCDDSGSMSNASAVPEKTRMQAQTDLVEKIADIATRALPEDMKRVHLRFINRPQQFNDISPSELPGKMDFQPDGGTPLGTSLETRILQPFVYDVLEEDKPLPCPYLILTITDGDPNCEHTDAFRLTILKSKEYVTKRGYNKAAVTFDLSQLGNDTGATKFLENLSNDKNIQDVLHCTAEHLDFQFNSLRENKANLEEWLLDKLKAPITIKEETRKDK